MSNKQYAEHRGVTPAFISKLKARGFLDDALVKKRGRKIPLIDSDKADAMLESNLDPHTTKKKSNQTKPLEKKPSRKKSKKVDNQSTYAQVRTESERYKAQERRLKLEVEQRKWISRAEVKDTLFKVSRLCRDTLLNIGPRIAAQVAAETDENEILKLINHEHNEALAELIHGFNSITD